MLPLMFGSVTYLPIFHLAIDDATGKIAGAYFDDQETLNSYYRVLYQILVNYGIPYKFLTDRRTVFEKQPSIEKINQILAVIAESKIDAGHCIQFENKYYIPVTGNNMDVNLKKGMTALVIRLFDGRFYVNILDQLFALKEIPKRLERSKEFDEVKEPRTHKIYIPPMSHTWKHASFMAFVNIQRNRQTLRQ